MIRRALALAFVLAAAIVPAPADGTAIPVAVAVVDERFRDWPTEVVVPVASAVPQDAPSAATSHGAPSWAPTSISGRALAWPRLWAGETGIVSTYGVGYDGYWALPFPYGAGWRVEVCGPGGCVSGVSNDYGPVRGLHRIADLDIATFERACGVSWRMGLCVATVTVKGRAK